MPIDLSPLSYFLLKNFTSDSSARAQSMIRLMLLKYNTMLTSEEYQKYTKEIERILKKLGEDTNGESSEMKELDRLSEAVAAYELASFPSTSFSKLSTLPKALVF